MRITQVNLNCKPTNKFQHVSSTGFLLNKKVGMHQPQKVENAKILIANTPMDTDKIKVFGSRVKVDNVSKVAEIELAEKEKMKDKVEYLKRNIYLHTKLIFRST